MTEESDIDVDTNSLYSVIDKDNVHGLNLTVPEDAKAVIKPWDDRDDTSRFAESQVDDQMIIHVPFSQNVRLKSIALKLGRGEVNPRSLRIFANSPTILDFSDIEAGAKPQLDIGLLEGEMGVTEYPLRVAAFSSINSLSIFFADSPGGDASRVYYLGFKGDVRAPKKDTSSKLEIPAANAADAPLVDKLQEKTGNKLVR